MKEFSEILKQLEELTECIELTKLNIDQLLRLRQFFIECYSATDDYFNRHCD